MRSAFLKIGGYHTVIAALLLLAFSACKKPDIVSLGPDTPRTVILNWQASPKATSYNVYRTLRPGEPFQKIGSSTTTHYSDSPVPAHTSVFYTVSAVNEHGESGPSNRVVVTIP